MRQKSARRSSAARCTHVGTSAAAGFFRSVPRDPALCPIPPPNCPSKRTPTDSALDPPLSADFFPMSERTCPCGRTFSPRTGTQRFCCAEHRARYHAQRRAAQEPARYGSQHQKLRRAMAQEVEAGGVACARCGGAILPGEPWDLGHVDGGEPWQYAGPEHRRHNRQTSTHRAARRATLAPGSPGTLNEAEWQALSAKERGWRSGDLNPRRRHSREW
jgi:hypothetical protein